VVSNETSHTKKPVPCSPSFTVECSGGNTAFCLSICPALATCWKLGAVHNPRPLFGAAYGQGRDQGNKLKRLGFVIVHKGRVRVAVCVEWFNNLQEIIVQYLRFGVKTFFFKLRSLNAKNKLYMCMMNLIIIIPAIPLSDNEETTLIARIEDWWPAKASRYRCSFGI
jgi:hypothetical protein